MAGLKFAKGLRTQLKKSLSNRLDLNVDDRQLENIVDSIKKHAIEEGWDKKRFNEYVSSSISGLKSDSFSDVLVDFDRNGFLKKVKIEPSAENVSQKKLEPKVFNPGIEQEYYKEKNAKKIANKNQEIANNNQKEFDNGQLESIGHNAQIIEKQRNEQRISEYNRKTKDKIRARREYLNAKRDLDNAEMPKKGDTSDSYDALRRTAGEKRKALRLVSKELSEDETYQKALAEAKAKRKEAPFERIYNKTYDHHYQRRIANGWSEEDAVKAATEEAELAKNNAKNSSSQKAADVQNQANETKPKATGTTPKAGGTPKTDQQSGEEVKKKISGSYNPIDSFSYGGKKSWAKGYRKARQQYEDVLTNGTDEEKSKILGLVNTEKYTPEQLADAKFMAKTIAKDQFKGGPSFGDYVAGNPKTLTAAGGVAVGFGAIATVNSNGGRRSNSSLYGSPF